MIISMIAYTAERGFDVNEDDVISSESEGTIVVSSSALQHVLIFPILLYTSYTLYSHSFLKRAFFILGFAIIWTLLYVSMAAIALR